MAVFGFDFIVTGMHLNEYTFSGFVRIVRHRTVQREVAKEKHVSGFRLQNGCVLNRVSVRNLSIFSAAHHAICASELLVGTRIDANTPHLISSLRDVDNRGYHAVFDRGKILPILVHRERCACFRWFTEKLGVVKHDIRSKNGFGRIKKLFL